MTTSKEIRKVATTIATVAKVESELLAIQHLLNRYSHHYNAHKFVPKSITEKIKELNNEIEKLDFDFDEIIEKA